MIVPYFKITIYIPFEGWPLQKFITAEDVYQHPTVVRILEQAQLSGIVGKLGNYIGVHEATIGFEGFAPTEGANPVQGKIGEAERVPMVSFTTYIAATAEDVTKSFVEEVSKVHPWEYPVIEIQKIEMWTKEI